MNIKELAEKVVEAHPKISLPVALQTLRTALGLLKEEIEAADEGNVNVATFGSFRSRPVVGKDGATTVRRFFVPAKPRAEADAAAEPAESATAG
jgi:hypothetical protein